jgi:GrpB-like predicted nucleotidyltransferase (UPF0157 family)
VLKTLEQRIEEAIREEIFIVPYDLEWPTLFREEAKHLRSELPRLLVGRIEHFGSTAVPGLAAKPIIDMLVEVGSLDETQRVIVPLLEAEGYDYFWRTDVSPAYAWFIKRDPKGKRTHHIHMVEPDSKLWDRLFFRDYLRDFPDEAQRYSELKELLSQQYAKDRIAYTEGKTDYVVSVTGRARKYYEHE